MLVGGRVEDHVDLVLAQDPVHQRRVGDRTEDADKLHPVLRRQK